MHSEECMTRQLIQSFNKDIDENEWVMEETDDDDNAEFVEFSNEDDVWDLIYDERISKIHHFSRVNDNGRIYFSFGYVPN